MIGAMRIVNLVPLRRSLQQFAVHPGGLRLSKWPVDDQSEMAIDGEPVAHANALRGFGHARHTRDTVLAGYDRAVDQHAAAALDDSCRQRHHQRHVGVDGIADEDFPTFEREQVGGAVNHSRRSGGDTWARRLTEQLAGTNRPADAAICCLAGAVRSVVQLLWRAGARQCGSPGQV